MRDAERLIVLECDADDAGADAPNEAMDDIGSWLTIVRHLVRCSVRVASGRESRCATR